MTKHVAATKRTTVYRMIEGVSLEEALRDKYRKEDGNFNVEFLDFEGLEALLVHGSITTPSKWASDVSVMTGQAVRLNNTSPGAALVIEDANSHIWVLSWGTGFHFLDFERIDFRFGARVVARSANPGDIKSVTRTILDHRSRVDRSSQPSGGSMRDLGVDEYGEVVSRIEAKAVIPGLTVGDSTIQLKAADSLNLPLAKKASNVVRDLKVLNDLLDKPVLPGLEGIEQLIALKAKDSRVAQLNARLAKALGSGDTDRLSVSWPHERLDQWGPFASCKVTGFGDRSAKVFEDAPDLSEITSWFRGQQQEVIEARLGKIQIELYSDATPSPATLVSNAVPARRWLTYEVLEGEHRYCLHDGSWYQMDDRYLERIDGRVREILAKAPSLALPAWSEGENERNYNVRAASLLNGYSLDRNLISTPLHSRGGIEPCDIFVPEGTLIHVKRGRDSASLSHLIAQALVSTETLARDDNGRKAWRERITSVSGGKITDAPIKEVILGIGRAKPLDVDSLFTFTKVNLVKQYDALKFLGVPVKIAAIPED